LGRAGTSSGSCDVPLYLLRRFAIALSAEMFAAMYSLTCHGGYFTMPYRRLKA